MSRVCMSILAACAVMGLSAASASAAGASAASASAASASAAPITAEIFKDKGCIQCHKVTAYNIEGGETGPDLSIAYTDVKDRFGMPLDKFLKEPTGTMQIVLGSMIKLNNHEKAGIYKLLKEASQKSAKK